MAVFRWFIWRAESWGFERGVYGSWSLRSARTPVLFWNLLRSEHVAVLLDEAFAVGFLFALVFRSGFVGTGFRGNGPAFPGGIAAGGTWP